MGAAPTLLQAALGVNIKSYTNTYVYYTSYATVTEWGGFVNDSRCSTQHKAEVLGFGVISGLGHQDFYGLGFGRQGIELLFRDCSFWVSFDWFKRLLPKYKSALVRG